MTMAAADDGYSENSYRENDDQEMLKDSERLCTTDVLQHQHRSTVCE